MPDPRVEQALRDLEVTANNFAVRLIRMSEVRSAYVERIAEMSRGIRTAVEAGELPASKGAALANEMRNEIMEMQRLRDLDLGRALARSRKGQGLPLDEAITRAMNKNNLGGRAFEALTGEEQRRVYLEVIESAGRSDFNTTRAIPRMRWAARGLWLATFAVAAYNIGTAEDPWWQTGRESANIAGGLTGGFVGGAAMGAAAGVWGGPVGVAIGVAVGGILGALLADRAYVEAVGTSDPKTRFFIGRFTSFWLGVDEKGLARALATEHRANPAFVQRVLRSLHEDYYTDADDVAFEFVRLMRHDGQLAGIVRGHAGLRSQMIELMEEGWTSGGEQGAIGYLRRL